MIVETKSEIDHFLDRWNRETSTVIPIWVDLYNHPMNNTISFLYVRFETGWYIIPIDHNDCKSIQIDLSQSTQKKFVWNKKGLLQSGLEIQNVYDIQTQHYFFHNETVSIDHHIESLRGFYYKIGIRTDQGKIIPITRWIGVLEEFYSTVRVQFNKSWVDSTMIPVLSKLEESGIRVDTNLFLDKWKSKGRYLCDDIVYTEYNPYALTSRPSNRHGGINYSALNKSDGTRKIFIPKPDCHFVQFDYVAYHVSIIAKLIGYTLPSGINPHQWLADQYGCDYSESKSRTFRIIYGGISDEDKKIPFFNQMDQYINSFYNKSVADGSFRTQSGREIKMDWIANNNPYKCFSYLLQAMETELNIGVLEKLVNEGLPLPELYTYDSFLFSFEDTDKSTMYRVSNVLTSNGYIVKVTVGNNYDEL